MNIIVVIMPIAMSGRTSFLAVRWRRFVGFTLAYMRAKPVASPISGSRRAYLTRACPEIRVVLDEKTDREDRQVGLNP